jgi:hypothetical protein
LGDSRSPATAACLRVSQIKTKRLIRASMLPTGHRPDRRTKTDACHDGGVWVGISRSTVRNHKLTSGSGTQKHARAIAHHACHDCARPCQTSIGQSCSQRTDRTATADGLGINYRSTGGHGTCRSYVEYCMIFLIMDDLVLNLECQQDICNAQIEPLLYSLCTNSASAHPSRRRRWARTRGGLGVRTDAVDDNPNTCISDALTDTHNHGLSHTSGDTRPPDTRMGFDSRYMRAAPGARQSAVSP